MKIRKRDGTMAEVGDAYILQDGESLTVGLMFMDAKRGMVRDAAASPQGNDPAFCSATMKRTSRRVEAAYREYAATVSERWRQGPQGQRSNPTQPEPQTFDKPGSGSRCRLRGI